MEFSRRNELLVLVFILLNAMLFATRPNGSYPRLMSYYLSAFPTSQNNTLVPLLSRYDVIVLDMEMGETNPTATSSIRQANPNIKILAYMSCEEISITQPSQTISPLRYQLYNGIQPEWWLMTASGEHAHFWDGTYMLNCSIHCPVVNGQTWNSYFSNFITTEVLSNPIWDGFFVDNCWSIVPWDAENIDCDNNGIVDDRTWLDTQWQAGMVVMLNNLRTLNPNEILVGNAGYNYGQYLNGAMIEGWDEANPGFEFGFNWSLFMDIYSGLETSFQPEHMSFINPMELSGFPGNLQHMRYLLTTSLLGSAYFGIDLGPDEHAATWWYDEYNCNLGQPLTPFSNEYSTTEANEIHNGTMDNSLIEWQLDFVSSSSGSLVDANENENHYAQCHVNITDGNDYSAQFRQFNNPDLTFTFGERYLVTFRAKANQARTINFVVQNHINYNWVVQNHVDITLSTEWQTFSHIIQSNNTYGYPPDSLRFSFNLGEETGTVCFDDVSFTHVVNRVAQRQFDNGLVLCNPGQTAITVDLNGTYYHILGIQDTNVNNGQPCTSVTLQSHDGVILLNSPVENNNDYLQVSTIASCFPNPFSQSTTIKYNLKQTGRISLRVFNIKGQFVKTLTEGLKKAGENTEIWSGDSDNHEQLSAGVYFVRLQQGNEVKTSKVLYLK